MLFPPDLGAFAGSRTTNAVINTQNTATTLAAPGAGVRYRLWGVSAVLFQNATGIIRLKWANVAGGQILAEQGVSPQGPSDPQWWPGGIVMATNDGLQVRDISNVASQSYDFVIYYGIEST